MKSFLALASALAVAALGCARDLGDDFARARVVLAHGVLAEIDEAFAVDVHAVTLRRVERADDAAGAIESTRNVIDIANTIVKLVAELRQKLNSRLTGYASALGDPRIRAGAMIRLEGLGVDFSDVYRVTKSTEIRPVISPSSDWAVPVDSGHGFTP